jgi:hypothetical protein
MANDLTDVRSKLSGPSYPASVSLSASVASAIEQSRQTTRKRTRKLAFVGGGALAAMAVIGIAWSQFPRSRSTTTAAADTSATAGARALPPPPAATPAVTLNAGVATAQAEPVPQPPAKKDRAPATSRDSRTTPVKPTPKAVQSKVAPPPVRQNVNQPAPALSTRQETLPSPPPVVAAAPVVTAPKQEAPKQEPAPSTPSPPTTSDIAPAVEAFARAIESKDIGTVRREFPGLTSEQVRRFEQFFSGARTINATFRVANVEGSGSSAVARLEGNYTFVTNEGVTERQPVSFAVTLRPDGKGWRLVSMR